MTAHKVSAEKHTKTSTRNGEGITRKLQQLNWSRKVNNETINNVVSNGGSKGRFARTMRPRKNNSLDDCVVVVVVVVLINQRINQCFPLASSIDAGPATPAIHFFK